MMKQCTKCKEFKDFSEFNKRAASKKDGLHYWCKKCAEESRKVYRKTEKGKNDRKKESKKYRTENSEKVKENNNRNNKKWRQTPKGKEQTYRTNVKRRSYEFKVDFTFHQRRGIIERDNWTCQICHKKVHDEKVNCYSPDKAHIDHIIPISKGGNSEPSNLRLLCASCNLKKADKVLT